MWDRYDPRSDGRDRAESADRSFGSRGGSNERDHGNEDRDPRDLFTRDLDLPRGRERQAVRGRDRAPVWKSYNWTALTAECHAEFRRINLRWHDLRHEYASRLVEKGVPVAQVRDLLCHASITTTERYDNQKLENLQAAAARLERGETFIPPPAPVVEARKPRSFRLKPEATKAQAKSARSTRRLPSNRQYFVKSWDDQHAETEVDREAETSTNSHADQDLENWLGVRDDFRNWLLTAA